MDSFAPSVKVKPSKPDHFSAEQGEYGVRDLMTSGFANARSQLKPAHVLEHSECNYSKNEEFLSYDMLRRVQGLHAPLKLMMEKKALQPNKIGRLPFLESSNALLDSLTGRDLTLGFEDILNTAEFAENLCQPHSVVERSLGIL